LARRAGTLDPVLAELRAELLHRLPAAAVVPARDIEQRRNVRAAVKRHAKLRVADLVTDGEIHDVGSGGVFFHTNVLVEAGERCILEVDGVTPVAGRVVWQRSMTERHVAGIGIAFEIKDHRSERAALELVLSLLD
jgi:Tfp pilus assembly protein PilZ